MCQHEMSRVPTPRVGNLVAQRMVVPKLALL